MISSRYCGNRAVIRHRMSRSMEAVAAEGEFLLLDCREGVWTHLFRFGVFRFYYTMDGSASTPKNTAATVHEEVPDYLLRLAAAFVDAHTLLTEKAGLSDPLRHGRFHRENVCFIDIFIDDIPKQRGLVSGEPVDRSGCFGNHAAMQGKSVRIRLHRALIADSATPIHELFHVFQYAYAPFTNPWFMEGLARWSQTLVQRRPMKPETLPKTMTELKGLFDRAHDAEYFWRRLFGQCADADIVRRLLEAAAAAAAMVERTAAAKPMVWNKERKAAFGNDRLLLQCLIDSCRTDERTAPAELLRFLKLARRFVEKGGTEDDPVALQRFYAALKTAVPDAVEEEKGLLHSGHFDPATGRLRLDRLSIGSLSRHDRDALDMIESFDGELVIEGSGALELGGFNRLRKLGALRIENNASLESIDGFNALTSLHSLQIKANPLLGSIGGFRSLFAKQKHFPGAIRITDNPMLDSIVFLRGIRSTASSFYLHHNALETLEGLESLESVGASFSLASNRLKTLEALRNLTEVNGMFGAGYNALHSLEGIDNLRRLKTVRWNGIPRTLSIEGNPQLRDIGAISKIRTAEDYLIFFVDDIKQYEVRPPSTSPFHRNIVELYDRSKAAVIPTYRFVRKKGHDYRRFRKATHLGLLTHLVDFEVPSETLVISFSGYNGFLGGMFHNRYPYITATRPSHKLFVMDRTNSWYHHGVKGLYRDIEMLFEQIRVLIKAGNYRQVVCFGASMGGYLALAAATIDGVTDVLAFSPQTFLDRANRERFGDDRWKNDIERVQKDTPTPSLLDLRAYYREKGVPKAKIRIHYASRITLDAIHARHLEAPFLERIAHDADTHYLAAWLHEKKRLRPMILSLLGADPHRPRVLFGHNWKKATARCEWMDAFHMKWRKTEALLDYCYANDITLLFANNYSAQIWLANHGDMLRERGMQFIVNSVQTLRLFIDKPRFTQAMEDTGYGEFVSKEYSGIDDAVFPCVVKPYSGGAGRGVFIANDADDIPRSHEKMMLTEYLPGTREYATTFFLKKGKLLFERTYLKQAESEPYILQTEASVDVKKVTTPFSPLLKEIVDTLDGGGEYCLCSINYKMVGGSLKIFEINPRPGYTLAQHPEDFKEFMACYISEAAGEKS